MANANSVLTQLWLSSTLIPTFLPNGSWKRLDNLVDVISMQQETIRNLQEKIKQLQNQ